MSSEGRGTRGEGGVRGVEGSQGEGWVRNETWILRALIHCATIFGSDRKGDLYIWCPGEHWIVLFNTRGRDSSPA